MRRLIALFAALLLAGGTLACQRQQQEEEAAQAEEAEQQEQAEQEQEEAAEEQEDEEMVTIADVASETDDLSTLTAALEAADLVDTLAGEGPFTVFAPTDEAFEALPEGKLDELLKEENKSELQRILKYHVLSGEVMSEDVEAGEVETVEGSMAEIEVTDDGEVLYSGATVVETDIAASNGVIHIIDKVVMPPEKGSSM